MKNVAVERIFSEFARLICGSGAGKVLAAFPDVIGVFLPEILPAVGFRQQHPRHIYDVWEHTAMAVQAAPADKAVRLALLFHDLGKPMCASFDERGGGHFYGHGEKGEELCRAALKRLRCDGNTARVAELLVKYHGTRLCPMYPGDFYPFFREWRKRWRQQGDAAFRELPMEKAEPGLRQARRWLGKLGEQRLGLLLEVQRADIRAQDLHFARDRLQQLENFEGFLELARATNQCYCLRDLKVDGKMLMEIGFHRGPEVGRALEFLLEEVVEGRLMNERELLLRRAQTLL